MIDWWSVFANGLWLLALALLLAAASMAYYRAGEEKVGIRAVLARPPYDAVLAIGGVLFFAGLAAADDRLWATALYLLLAAAAAGLFFYYRHQPPDE
jgi:hypothetical protein